MILEKVKRVYVIYNPLVDITKIGVSDNVRFRLDTLINASGVKLLLYFHTRNIINFMEVESMAHSYFDRNRGIGEWFKIKPDAAVNYLRSASNRFALDELYSLLDEGVSISEIAASLGVSRQAIMKRVKDDEINKNTSIVSDINQYTRMHKGVYKCNNTGCVVKIEFKGGLFIRSEL